MTLNGERAIKVSSANLRRPKAEQIMTETPHRLYGDVDRPVCHNSVINKFVSARGRTNYDMKDHRFYGDFEWPVCH